MIGAIYMRPDKDSVILLFIAVLTFILTLATEGRKK
jgi:hypothetical protein